MIRITKHSKHLYCHLYRASAVGAQKTACMKYLGLSLVMFPLGVVDISKSTAGLVVMRVGNDMDFSSQVGSQRRLPSFRVLYLNRYVQSMGDFLILRGRGIGLGRLLCECGLDVIALSISERNTNRIGAPVGGYEGD